MNLQTDWKPALLGAVGGALALAIVGFTWGGWVTQSRSQASAKQSATSAVVAALAPICASQFQMAANAAAQQADLVKRSSWDQEKKVEEAGWAKMPGSTEVQAGVAQACADMIVKLKF